MTSIIKAAHYDIEETRIAEHNITKSMFATLPKDFIDKLVDGEHIPDFMTMCNREWKHRATEQGIAQDDYPRHLGAVQGALRIIALDQ